MIAVDTNIIVYLLRPSPWQPSALALYASDPDWVAPPLWRSEFRNVLSLTVRRHEISVEQAVALLAEADDILKDSGTVEQPGHRDILELARASGCTAYDCEYVALALRLGVPLVTMDRQVLKAFPTLAVPLAA